MVYLRALKSWQKGQLNLAHGTKKENKEETKKPSSSEETARVIVREGRPGWGHGATWLTKYTTR